MPAIRVGIADDEALMRHGLRMLIDGDPHVTCTGEATNGKEALSLAPHCDVLLLDLRMPVLDGLEALEFIVHQPNAPKVLVLTAFDTEHNVLTALRRGATGFLLKTTPPAQLIGAIHAAATGQPLVSQQVLQSLLNKATPTPQDPRLNKLSGRERDVAKLIAQGKSNDEIARELFVSLSTVKTHITRIMEKLECNNRVSIAIAELGSSR
ncbi:response regulator transcription factor [Corynebacterium sp. H128]|uniref:response regulator transcription factor n=1 Tax=unclassified Corynebacterium TaxID=2624378 RepID=UPI0030989BE9